MKIYINCYKYHWLSPYTVLEKVLFWKDWDNIEYSTPWVERWSDRLLPICNALQKVLDFLDPKINYVKIDYWDTWSMDHTLAHVILPMLKQLKEKKHGAPFVDDGDVPEELKSTSAPPKENEWDIDDNHFKRWDWVMGEMIQAFECKVDEKWDEKYWTGTSKIEWQESNVEYNGKKTSQMVELGDRKCDWDAYKAHEERNSNGFRLFGKYYQGLWD
jgi:hypothetical protein